LSRTFKAVVATFILAVGFAGSVAADEFTDRFKPMLDAVAAFNKGDYETARQLYLPLAEKGDFEAQRILGYMFRTGLGGPPNNADAAKWYKMAAEQGENTAQWTLGLMYEGGHGVPQNYVIAYMWINLAAAKGNTFAAEDLKKVTSKMTPAQIAEALKLAREWKPQCPTGVMDAGIYHC
jgi:uncharacterized protein